MAQWPAPQSRKRKTSLRSMAEVKDAKAPKIRPRPVEYVLPRPTLTYNETCAANGGRRYTGGPVRIVRPRMDWRRSR